MGIIQYLKLLDLFEINYKLKKLNNKRWWFYVLSGLIEISQVNSNEYYTRILPKYLQSITLFEAWMNNKEQTLYKKNEQFFISRDLR